MDTASTVGHHYATIVYVPCTLLRGECTRNDIQMSEADAEVLIASRFTVFPIRFLKPEYWTVFIIDKSKKAKTLFPFDSMETGRIDRVRNGLRHVKWMVQYAA